MPLPDGSQTIYVGGRVNRMPGETWWSATWVLGVRGSRGIGPKYRTQVGLLPTPWSKRAKNAPRPNFSSST